jgi:hypothetical protein
MHPWLPKQIDPNLIPAIRSLGKRGTTIAEHRPILGRPSASFHFGGATTLTLAEQRATDKLANPLLVTLGAILAAGPKLFVIPDDMIDDLNQIEIPLAVKDYSQPFPAVIVKSGQGYHYVCVIEGRIVCATVTADSLLDFTTFFVLDAPIEKNLSDKTCLVTTDLPGGRAMAALSTADFLAPHRFRATLNFLLLVTAGGFVVEKARQRPKTKHGHTAKHTDPTIYKPQDIDLWRKRLIDANHPSGEKTGGSKTPHWRRAHWRRVAVGAGRVGRELRLIKACLVNKDKLATDPADSEYVCH